VRVAGAATEAAFLSGHDRLAMWALEAAALAAYWAGDVVGALADAREAIASAERTAEPYFSSLSRLQLAGAQLAAGEAAAARSELVALDTDRTRRMLDLSAGHGWTLLTEAHVALGEIDEAAEVAARAETRAEAAPLPQQLAGARLTRGLVALARGDAAGAVAAGRDAAVRFDRAGNQLFGARARVLVGSALARVGERQAAAAELERADAVLSACGARQRAAEAARELRRLGRRVIRRRTPATSRWGADELSAREREVARRVTMGETNREVAAALFLSEKTIESHLARIYDKLGVDSRRALAAIIVREERSPESGSLGGARRR
jgi:DNA-binding CsgD family transcriptional regulator